MEEAVKLTVRLPQPLHERVSQRARQTRRSLNQLIVDAVRREVEEPQPEPQSERERILAVLREAGMLAPPLGPAWDEYIQATPDVTIEEVRELWADQPPLSEDIIAMRGEL
ncbi:MAG: toxin-antitoxin system HicB family antitoxin [Chloroflexi bacterium]|nr:toxin-antitoxin system HicB family antitoxin [Chloroflexota bacterium]MBU1748704.1 toxin-antitoxin system HicB family antitoxin [Chloroflexota bacterium]